MKKFELTEETKCVRGITLHRIKAVVAFGDVQEGDLGGLVEGEENLSQYGDAWVSGDAWVYGNACVYGDACVSGDARVSGDEDYIVFKNWWSSGRYFTWTRSNDMWRAGCFYGTGKELVAKAYKDSEKSGREYQRIVDYVEEIKKDK